MGGLITFLRKGIEYTEVNCGTTQLLEYLAVRVEGRSPFLLINVYLPGGAKLNAIKASLYHELELLMNTDYPFFLVGDFNARNTLWDCVRNNTAGKILLETAEKFKCIISHSEDPTYCPISDKKAPSTIDLIVTNAKLDFSRPYVKNIMSSDHVPVFFTKNYSRITMTRTALNYKNTNWKRFRELMDEQLYLELLIDYGEWTSSVIDRAIVILSEAVKSSLSATTPTVRSRFGVIPDDTVKSLIAKRNFYRRRWTRSRLKEYKDQYYLLNKLIKELTKRQRLSYESDKLKECTLKNNNIFKIIKSH